MFKVVIRTIGIALVVIFCACGEQATPPSGGCGALSCPGCCLDGVCYKGDELVRCGSGGGACAQCGLDMICQDGMCSSSSGNCSPDDCDGCCQGNICLAGIDDSACGLGGQTCIDCSAMGGCVSGKCGNCTPNCTNKCIGGSDGCGGFCTQNDCPGCCTSSSVCELGASNSACGVNGSTCQDCTAIGSTCESGTCKSTTTDPCVGKTGGTTSCTDSSGNNGKCWDSQCCTGCYDASSSTCVTNTSKNACGKDGASCNACAAFETCTNAACTLSSASKWDFKAVSAEIEDTGKKWDWPGSATPEPYFGVDFNLSTCSVHDMDKCSPSAGTTFTPSWNHLVGTYTASELIAGFCAFVVDLDIGWPCVAGVQADEIGGCNVTIAEADLKNGYKEITSCPNSNDATNYIKKLRLEFTYKP